MPSPASLGQDEQGRRFYVASLAKPEDWPAKLDLASPTFGLFLACDATTLPLESLSSFAELTLNQGLCFVCAWGPDCSLVDDLYDEIQVMRALDTPPASRPAVVLTAWHEGQSLEEAVEFFFNDIQPDDASGCRSWIAVSIDLPEAAKQIHELLTNWLDQRA